ncbi:MAG: hypothetical protein QFF03_23785 [Pseudomonadota bacterium]|nr:hypothetical protein [Pseudomonadota bacterium]
MPDTDILETLPIERRLALAYAPPRAKRLWLGFFALDARLGTTVHNSVEPVLTQIKLAWWRGELAKPHAQRRRGEPLLELLDAWGDDAACLAALVDGWELLLGDLPPGPAEAQQYADERARACLGLAARLGIPTDDVAHAARGWALADLNAAIAEPGAYDWRPIKLPRALRPLQVLYGLAARSRGKGPLMPGPVSAMRAVRLGLLGI